MERVMSQEERIKRAEEIYYRRKMGNGVMVSTSSVNVGKKNKVSLGKKMVVQLLVCTLIYAFIFAIRNKESNFSRQTIETVSNVLNYDINMVKVYGDCAEYMKNSKIFNFNLIDKNNEKIANEEVENNNDNGKEADLVDNQEKEDTQAEENIEVNENKEENNETENNNQISENNVVEDTSGIGGADISNEQIQPTEKSQMEIDAEYIKENCNLIVPVKGYITSGYGDREPTEIISAFHQGVDIGATTGTEIHAAMNGKVIAASYAGDYGNHIKIQNGEVMTVYAHCSELNVSVGDEILQNQVIGKVGSTRKSNRSTLTF